MPCRMFNLPGSRASYLKARGLSKEVKLMCRVEGLRFGLRVQFAHNLPCNHHVLAKSIERLSPCPKTSGIASVQPPPTNSVSVRRFRTSRLQ